MPETGSQVGSDASEPTVSDVLAQLAEGGSVITVEDIVGKMEERAIGAVLCILSFPCSIPSPPGIQTVFGWPIIFVSLQMVAGRKQLWLPQRVLRMRIKGKTLATLARKAHPLMVRFEGICRPRLSFVTSKPAERLIGVVIFLLGVKLLLPLPLTNNPAGAASTITSLGLIEKDGLVVLVGLVLGVGVLAATLWFYGLLLYSMVRLVVEMV